MRHQLKYLGAAVSLAALSGCVTYPYEDSFAACDRAAAQCYRGCDDSYGYGGNYGASDRCRRDCDYSANRCFDSAYSPYRSSYGYDGYGASSWPWRGSYGYWYPDRGYFFSYNYGSSRYRGSYRDPYGYDRPGSRPGGSSRPPRPRPGSTPPPGGYQPPPGGGSGGPPPGGGSGGYPPPGGGYQPPPGGGQGGGSGGPPPPPPGGGYQPPPPSDGSSAPSAPSFDPPRQADPDAGPRERPNPREGGGRRQED